MKLGIDRIGVDQVPLEVHVSEGGEFSAEFDEERYTATTRKELLEKLEKAVKAARETNPIDVTVLGLVPVSDRKGGWSSDPFEAGAGVVQAKLRGKHQREYNAWLMITDDGKKRFKYSSSRRESIQIARRLNAAEVREYLALREAIRVAETALEDFVGKVQIDPEEALQAARKAKATNG